MPQRYWSDHIVLSYKVYWSSLTSKWDLLVKPLDNLNDTSPPWSLPTTSNLYLYSSLASAYLCHPPQTLSLDIPMGIVVATTRWNSTRSLLTSAKLIEGYLVVEITRELNKEPLLHCSSIYINTMWSMLQQYLLALMSIPLPHVLLLIYHASTSRPPYHVYVPWHHTL